MELQTARARSRFKANMENSSFVSDAELNYYINQAYKEVYSIICSIDPDQFTNYTEFTVSESTNPSEDLPDDFYKVRSLDYKTGNDYIDVHPFNFKNRNRFEITYRIVGSKILFTPRQYFPTKEFRMWYIPKVTELSADDDEFVTPVNCDEYIILRASISMMMKEESDTSELRRDLADQMLFIKKERRNVGGKIADVGRNRIDYFYGPGASE